MKATIVTGAISVSLVVCLGAYLNPGSVVPPDCRPESAGSSEAVSLDETDGKFCTVEPDGTGDYPTIQDAIDAGCDLIALSDGTFKGSDNRDIDFEGESIWILSASNDPKRCTIDCEGKGRGFKFHSGEGPDARVENITLANGSEDYGAGIYCSEGSHPTITGCVIENGVAGYGGGIYWTEGSQPAITGCVISGNEAYVKGGGIYASGASETMEISDCDITGNRAHSEGGGLYVSGGSPAITDCVIRGNYSDFSDGGGIYFTDNSSPTITGCVISGNYAFNKGGGIYSSNCPPVLTSCTISGNYAQASGGGIFGSLGHPTTRTIVWGNGAGSGEGEDWLREGCLPVGCCNCWGDVERGRDCYYRCYLGPDLDDEDPLFCAPQPWQNAPTTAGDYSLHVLSPCAPDQQPECGLIGALGVGCDVQTCRFETGSD